MNDMKGGRRKGGNRLIKREFNGVCEEQRRVG